MLSKLIIFISFISLNTWASPTTWTITRTEWTQQDERNFSNFVQALGNASCFTVNDCIRSSANPYRDTDPVDVKFWSDCADWPYFLRAYYAWKNNLPFSYLSSVGSFDEIEKAKNPPLLQPGEISKPVDLRASNLGNYPLARYNITTNKRTLNFVNEINKMQNTISSGMMRIGAEIISPIANDFYSPAIKPQSIRPGTIIYDPAGHVAVIYEIKPDGRILYFDAHPDNSITHGTFGAKFVRSRPAHGAGLKNFRPQRLVNAKYKNFEYIGGQVVPFNDYEIPDIALTQFYGTQPDSTKWSKGIFLANNKQVDVYEYIRSMLATEKVNPVNEFIGSLQELCEDFRERRDSVDQATAKQIYLKDHPETIPANIFSTSGEWEDYATPGRDTRMRMSFYQLQKTTYDRYQQYLKNDFSEMKYNGKDLKTDLLKAFHKVNFSCPVNYTNSAGQIYSLSFELGLRRLYKMSFDPYNCPERRWGATNPAELQTCTDDSNKTNWYVNEQRIRNFLQRDWTAPTDITLDQLTNLGTDKAADLDIRSWLQALPTKGQ